MKKFGPFISLPVHRYSITTDFESRILDVYVICLSFINLCCKIMQKFCRVVHCPNKKSPLCIVQCVTVLLSKIFILLHISCSVVAKNYENG